MPRLTRVEQETIVRWDEEDKTLDIYTASERFATQLMRRGYKLELVRPGWGWRLKNVPLSALTFRRIGPDVSGKPRRELSEGLRNFQRERNSPQSESEVEKVDNPDVPGEE